MHEALPLDTRFLPARAPAQVHELQHTSCDLRPNAALIFLAKGVDRHSAATARAPDVPVTRWSVPARKS
jgi:hypothetical protein